MVEGIAMDTLISTLFPRIIVAGDSISAGDSGTRDGRYNRGEGVYRFQLLSCDQVSVESPSHRYRIANQTGEKYFLVAQQNWMLPRIRCIVGRHVESRSLELWYWFNAWTQWSSKQYPSSAGESKTFLYYHDCIRIRSKSVQLDVSQPLHPCLLPHASRFSSLNLVPNPHAFIIGGRCAVMGHSGQPLQVRHHSIAFTAHDHAWPFPLLSCVIFYSLHPFAVGWLHIELSGHTETNR